MSYPSSKIIHRRYATAGFTLIEVLVTVVILAIGLLGLAQLQVFGLKSVHSSSLRSVAIFEAYNVLDSMRANRSAAESGNYIVGLDDVVTGTSIAKKDLNGWKDSLGQTLPTGKGSVSCSSGATCPPGSVHTVVVQWVDLLPSGQRGDVSFTVLSQL